MNSKTNFSLLEVFTDDERLTYHKIRNEELFLARGKTTYNPHHPDETKTGNFPLLFKRDGNGIGTVRLDLLSRSTACVRLVAITKHEQRKGYGRELMLLLENFAREKGITKLVLNAAFDAKDFYKKLGYVEYEWDKEELEMSPTKVVQMVKTI